MLPDVLRAFSDRLQSTESVCPSVCPSVRPSVHLFPLHLFNRLTFELDFCMCLETST